MPVVAKYSDVDYRGLPPLLPRRADFWSIPRTAEGETVYILGGGSSLKGVDLEPLRTKVVIGCNDAYQLGPELVPYCHFTDLKWWLQHKDRTADYAGTLTTCQQLVDDPKVRILRSKQSGVEFKDRSKIGANRNTGLAAINIAVHMGATRIVLLGFDMGTTANGWNWYKCSKRNEASYRMHRRFALEVWEDLNAHGGIEVINASPNSTLPYWPKCEHKEVI